MSGKLTVTNVYCGLSSMVESILSWKLSSGFKKIEQKRVEFVKHDFVFKKNEEIRCPYDSKANAQQLLSVYSGRLW